MIAVVTGHGIASPSCHSARGSAALPTETRLVSAPRPDVSRSASAATTTGAAASRHGRDSTSGSAQKITFGVSVTTATEVSPSGGEFDFIPTTTIHAAQQTQIPGTPTAGVYTFTNVWDISDAGLLAIKAASDTQTKRAVKFTFGAGGPIMCFNGYPAGQLLPGGQAQALVTTPTVITLSGTPSYYAS